MDNHDPIYLGFRVGTASLLANVPRFQTLFQVTILQTAFEEDRTPKLRTAKEVPNRKLR